MHGENLKLNNPRCLTVKTTHQGTHL